MKKTLLITILVAVMLIAAIGSVNAASLKASASEVKKGETVTVTIETKEAVNASSIKLQYDDTKFSYEGFKTNLKSVTENTDQKGFVIISTSDDANSDTKMTFTFKALVDDAEAKFTVTRYSNNIDETLDNTEVTVKIAKAEEGKEPVDPEEPTNPSDPEEPTNPEKPSEGPVDVNGKPIEKNPPTGTPL